MVDQILAVSPPAANSGAFINSSLWDESTPVKPLHRQLISTLERSGVEVPSPVNLVAPLPETIEITRHDRKKVTKVKAHETISRRDLVQMLLNIKTTIGPKDDLPLWSPAVFRVVGGPRTGENVDHVTAFVYDVDDGAQSDRVSCRLLELGLCGVMHTTYTNGVVAKEATPLVYTADAATKTEKFRLIMFASQSWGLDEHKVLWRALSHLLGLGADRQCTDVNRGFYVPFVHEDGLKYAWSAIVPGGAVNVDALRKMPAAPEATKAKRAIVTAAFSLSREDCKHQADAIGRKTAHGMLERKQMWERLWAGDALLERGHGEAHETLRTVTLAIAEAFPTATPESVAWILAPTWGGGEKEAKEVRDAFEGAVRIVTEEQAEREAQIETYREGGLKLADDGTGKLKVVPSPANIAKIARMPRDGKGLAGCLRLNVRGQILECRGLPWDPREAWREWTDADEMAMVVWLQDAWDLCVPSRGVHDPIVLAAHDHNVDPFGDWLGSLPAWDGTLRLDTWLPRTFGGAEDIYTRAISRKIVLSAIARAMDPGCKVDTKAVLVGPQGYLKSTTWEVLFGREFFSNASGDPKESQKDSLARLHRTVCYEDQEMAAHSARDVAADKAFLSTPEDVFRPPYGKNTGTFPRRFICVGTTNDEHGFLRDVSGGRRYWPFRCERRADIEWLRANRDQIWSEAMQAWSDPNSRQWWLTDEEGDAAARVQEEHREGLPYEDALNAALSDTGSISRIRNLLGPKDVREGRIQAATMAAVYALLQIDSLPVNAQETEKKKVSKALRARGFRERGSKKPRRYVAPDYNTDVPPPPTVPPYLAGK